jgi:hypothetical protein
MFNKKAQTATEYMIILAVVIIIALIVVGVLGGIPGIGTGAGGRASASYWATADIGITSYAAARNGTTNNTTVRLLIKNNFQDTIIIRNISMTPTGQSQSYSLIGDVNVTLGRGSEKYWLGTVEAAAGNSLCNSAGDAWVSNVKIVYENQVTGGQFTFTGEGTKLQGVCATSITTT